MVWPTNKNHGADFLIRSDITKGRIQKSKNQKSETTFTPQTFKTDKIRWAQNFDFLNFLLIKLILAVALYIVKQLDSTLLIKKLEN